MPKDNVPLAVIATCTTDDVEITYRGISIKEDFGVQRSPNWRQVEDITIDSLKVLGVEVDPSILPKELQTNILELSAGLDWSH